jgi:hypothetical protein
MPDEKPGPVLGFSGLFCFQHDHKQDLFWNISPGIFQISSLRTNLSYFSGDSGSGF